MESEILNSEIGIVQNLSGKFYVKDEDGNTVELRNGDVIEEGMVVVGDSTNTSTARMEIVNNNIETPIVLTGSQEQAFIQDIQEPSALEARYEEIVEYGNTTTEPTVTPEENSQDSTDDEVRYNATRAVSDFYQTTENGTEYNIDEDIVDTIEDVDDGQNVSDNLLANDDVIGDENSSDNREYENRVVIDEGLSSRDRVSTRSDNDEIIVNGGVKDSATVRSGRGDDRVSVDGTMEDRGSIRTGSGADEVVVGEALEDRANIRTGSGNDDVVINGNVIDKATIRTGRGDDSVVIEESLKDHASIRTGSGDDRLTIQNVEDSAKINLGSGDDTLTIKDVVSTQVHAISGGSGLDELVLENQTLEDWNNGLSNQFVDFESVKFSDGSILNLIDANSAITTYMNVVSVTVNGVEYSVDEDNTEITLPHGTITISPNGDFNYVVNNANSEVQSLNVGDSIDEVFTYTLSNGLRSSTADVTINIDGRDDAPVINSIVVNPDATSDVAILNDISLNDVDNANLEGASVALVNYKEGDSIVVGDLPDSITATVSGASVELSGNASIEQYETALKSLNFETTSDDTSNREFVFSVFDGEKHSEVQSVEFNLSGAVIVDAPVIESILDTTGNVDLSVNGTGNFGETITVYYGDEILGTTDVDETGNWSLLDSDRVLVSEIQDSESQSFVISAIASDVDGNVSGVSNLKTLITDGGDSISRIINGTEEDDIIYGGNEESEVTSSDSSDECDTETQTVTTAGDIIYAGAGDDEVYAGLGNDTISGEEGADLIDGGDGIDTIRYEDSSEGIEINLDSAEASGGDAEGDIISNVERIEASSHDDTLVGDSGNNYLLGEDGNDIIDARGGNNYLNGGSGDDIINGAGGRDHIVGGSGADTLDGGDGFDTLGYEDSDAAVSVNLSTNEVSGGYADGDVIQNFERVDGSSFDDSLTGDEGNNYLIGNAGDDIINGGDGDDYIEGGSGNDTIFGGDGRDTIASQCGIDTIDGGDGFDTIQYDSSLEAINVNLATNEVSGGYAEGDTISNIEAVRGSAYNDTLVGSEVNNYLIGNDGDDNLTGAGGNDYINGGAGDDIANYSGNFAEYGIEEQDNGDIKVIDRRDDRPDGIDTLSSIETLKFADGVYDVLNNEFTPIDVPEYIHVRNVEYHSDVENSTEYDDYIEPTLVTGDSRDIVIVEDDIGDEDDYVDDHGGARTVTTNAGDDIVAVGGDIQHGATLDTGDGDDLIVVGDSEYLTLDLDDKGSIEFDATVNAGDGNDILVADMLADSRVDMGNGDDTVTIGRIAGDSTLELGAGEDEVSINDVSSGFDDGSVNLGAGDDTLSIGDNLAGTDAIFDGGDGDDSLVLNNVTHAEWDAGVKNNFENFEHVTLNTSDSSDDGLSFDNIFDLTDGMNFDFSDNNLEGLNDIEAINMDNDFANSIEGITLDDILEMTDDNNTLTISGDDSDTLAINTDGWTQNGPIVTDTGSGMVTYEYANATGDVVTLNIDEQINSTGM